MINIFITLTTCTHGGYPCRPGRFYSGIGSFVIDILFEKQAKYRYRYGTAKIIVPGRYNIECGTKKKRWWFVRYR